MTSPFRALPAALVAAVLAVLACVGAAATGPASAAPAVPSARHAAVCQVPTTEAAAKSAQAVFTGTVTGVSASDRGAGQKGKAYVQTVTVTGIYNGKVTGETVSVRTERIPKQCSLGQLAVGTTYVFFVGGTGDPWTATGDSGTQPATPDVVSAVQALLGTPKSPVPPTAESASYTPVDTSDPQSLSRVAAPGAALVIIGLLGLAVVRGVARRPARG